MRRGRCCQPRSSGRRGAVRTERTGANFFAKSVLSANAEVESMRRGVGHWILVESRGAGVSHRSDEEEKEGKEEGEGRWRDKDKTLRPCGEWWRATEVETVWGTESMARGQSCPGCELVPMREQPVSANGELSDMLNGSGIHARYGDQAGVGNSCASVTDDLGDRQSPANTTGSVRQR